MTTQTASSDAPLLQMQGIDKSFPGVQALHDVALQVRGGEVHALVGENGAGKSTLMRILGGVHQRDRGEILWHGRPLEIRSPLEARAHGISIIHQELNQVPGLSVAENIFLGREPRRALGWVDWTQMRVRATRLLADLGLSIDPRRRLGTLTVAEQQLVEIAKALSSDAELVIMDEPTAALTSEETQRLFGFIRDLRARGVAVIYITHRLEEVFSIADRVTVLRDGQYVSTSAVGDINLDELIRLMVGRRLTEKFPKETFAPGEPVLEVRGLTRAGVFEDVSFVVHHGEILGIAGLIGSGKTEVAHAVFGADPIDRGEIYLDGRQVAILAPAAFIRRSLEQALVAQAIRDLHMAVTSPEQLARNLSGGTQQKAVVAKWLQTHARVLLLAEPTRGIDVGAKVEMYRLMVDLARRGVGIVMISSEMPEILGMSDRILVMHDGRITAEFSRERATQEAILASASGRTPSAV